MKKSRQKGKVILIGAGPGDPGLITVKGRSALERCDAVVYDGLAPAELLSLAPPAARKFYAGKTGRAAVQQAEINRLLVRLARQGKTVARLKGGDPFVFGRGGEEALALRRAGIAFEIIPGVTAALGAAACVGIPLTHRGDASQLTFVTAHEDPSKKESQIRWSSLAESGATLVFYMGVQTLPRIVRELLKRGMSPKTPAAVVAQATLPGQKTVEGTLRDISEKTRQGNISAPAVIIVGPVVRLRKSLDWFSRRPLRGKRVLVTRARPQAGTLRARLESLGADVLELPAIEIFPPADWAELDRAITELGDYDWVVFTSVNGVEKFMERVCLGGRDARVFGRAKIAAIGPATDEKLREYGLQPDCVPPEFVSESLARELSATGSLKGRKFLLLRADIARPYLKEELERKGASVREIAAYRTRPAKGAAKQLINKIRRGGIDFITFTSSSTVRNFVEMIGKKNLSALRSKSQWVSIGPVTSKTLEDFGLKADRQARRYDIPGLVDALAGRRS